MKRDVDPLDLSAPDLTESSLCAGRQAIHVSGAHLLLDFLEEVAGNSANEFKMQPEEELGILDTVEGF